MYSQKNLLRLNMKQFKDISDFIMKVKFSKEDVVKKEKYESSVKSLFKIFRSPVHNNITHKNFKRMIAIGN